MTVENKSVLITGGGQGFGMAMTGAFLQAGAQVTVIERDEQLVSEARQRLSAFGSRFEIVTLDVRDEAAVRSYLLNMERLDVVVNNAGIARKRAFVETPTAELREILEVNLIAAFVVMREATARMLERGGHIINIVSDSGVTGVDHMAPYSASKHGLLGLSRSARLELRQHNIRVTAFCPGSISTEIFGKGKANPSAMSPDALAPLVVYLAGLPPEIEVREILIEPMSLVETRYLENLIDN